MSEEDRKRINHAIENNMDETNNYKNNPDLTIHNVKLIEIIQL
jgi:hypothetical protein